jgi:hypothetical protein
VAVNSPTYGRLELHQPMLLPENHNIFETKMATFSCLWLAVALYHMELERVQPILSFQNNEIF